MRAHAVQHMGPGIALSLACAALSIVFAVPAAALDLSSVQKAAGVWELSRDDGQRKCTVQLRAEPGAAGNAIGLPPGCRHAMPAVANVAGWTLPAADRIEFKGQGGVSILSFSARANGLVAIGPAGESYVLQTAQDAARGGARPTVAAAAPAAPARALAPPPRPTDIAGRYSVLRDVTKDTGCMLTLQPGGKAQLAPACRDNGFVVFDPQAWSFAGGKLRLTARKGHHATFDYGADSTWQKDPKESGKPLGFRKM